jgi:hypothetical protein
MPRGPLRNVVDYLRGVASGRAVTEGTDGELLERFVRGKDEAAFETLLCRHGPMVPRSAAERGMKARAHFDLPSRCSASSAVRLSTMLFAGITG